MSELNTKKLDTLLEEGKLDEARAEIKSMLEGMPESERGELLVQFARGYMRVQGELNKKQRAVVQRAIAHVKTMKKDENEVIKEIAESA